MVRPDVAGPTRERHARAMARGGVTGAAGALGHRVAELLLARDDVDSVVAIDLIARRVAGAEVRQLDLATSDLDPAFDGADGLIHLASVFGPAIEGPEIDQAVEVTMARRVLAAADA